jgi:hypothetical protein
MLDRVRVGMAGRPGAGAGRAPEAWAFGASGDVSAVAEAVAGRSFLYEDPPSYRAGIADVIRALRLAGVLPNPA